MKILWISSWYPNRFSPQNGDFIQRMALSVSPFCSLAVLNASEGDCKAYEVEIRQGKILETVIYFPKLTGNINFINNIRRLWRHFRALYIGMGKVKKYFGQPDLIHLHVCFPAGYFVWIYLFFYQLPLVVTEHWSGFSKQQRMNLRFYHKLAGLLSTRKASVIAPVSHAVAKDMQELGFNGNYIIVPNIVDLDVFTHLKFKKWQSLPFTFLHVSSLNDKIKNVSGIIKAFKGLSIIDYSIQLKIVGEGEDRSSLERFSESLGLQDKIIFAGQISNELVAKEMQNANAFVLFSNIETFSCVLLEAMSVGLPAIASTCGGISEWIKEEDGILVEPGDEDGLKVAMGRILKEYSDFKPGVRRDIVLQCSKEIVGKQIFEIYSNILNVER